MIFTDWGLRPIVPGIKFLSSLDKDPYLYLLSSVESINFSLILVVSIMAILNLLIIV